MTLPPSDHFNGKTFFDPGGDRRPRPARPLEVEDDQPAPALAGAGRACARRPLPPGPTRDGIVATWVGHATFLLRTASAAILTDPIFSAAGESGGVAWAAPRRPSGDRFCRPAPAWTSSSFPTTTSTIATCRRCAGSRGATAPGSSPRSATVRSSPAPGSGGSSNSTGGNPHSLGGGEEVTLVPARHWCRRRPFATNRRLWGGFMLRAGGRLVYFAGTPATRSGFSRKSAAAAARPTCRSSRSAPTSPAGS